MPKWEMLWYLVWNIISSFWWICRILSTLSP